jgi:hypothetical protein
VPRNWSQQSEWAIAPPVHGYERVGAVFISVFPSGKVITLSCGRAFCGRRSHIRRAVPPGAHTTRLMPPMLAFQYPMY